MDLISKEIKSKNGNYYKIELFGNQLLNAKIKQIKEDTKKYKSNLWHLSQLKKSEKFEKDEKFQKYKDFSFIKNIENLEINEEGNNLNLIISLPEPHNSSIEILFELLNVEYFLSYGPKNERKNEKPFYNSLNSEIFNLAIIKDILDKDNIINRYNIDIYRFYDKDLNGFVKIDEEKDYIMPSENLILDLHFKEYIDQSRLDIDVINQGLTNEMHQMKNQIKYFQKNEEYDLIYLYASPIVNYSEISKPINYRSEIKNIIKLFNSSGKSFNCLFECANEKTFRDFIIKKKTKILHIAAHGDIDENGDYSLKLEDKGKMQSLNLKILENILKANSPKLKRIDLALVCTCHSEKLGILFKKYHVKNVIYIQSKNEISNIAALKFSEYFYEGLIKGLSIEDSFYKSQEKLSNDREVILINQNNCCCHHKHKKKPKTLYVKRFIMNFIKKYVIVILMNFIFTKLIANIIKK